jgi:hypothetical protein
MDIHAFAEKYRLYTRRDSCGDTIIPGKQFCADMPPRVEYRSHIYDGFTGERLGLCLLLETIRRCSSARKQLLAAGFTIKQNAEQARDAGQECCAIFDSENTKQARLAIRLAKIKIVKIAPPPSPAQIAAREAFKRRQQSTPPLVNSARTDVQGQFQP